MKKLYLDHTRKGITIYTLFLGLICFTINAEAATYYSKATGNINATRTWGQNTDGTGTAPPNFTTTGDIFIYRPVSNLNFPANNPNWTVGSGVTLILNGVFDTNQNNTTITINGTIEFTQLNSAQLILDNNNSDFTLSNTGTLKTANQTGIDGSMTISRTRTLSTSANYEFFGNNNQTTNGLPATVNNLTFSGSGTKTLAGAVTVNGNLNINEGATLSTSDSNHSISIAGNWTNNGTFTANSGTVTFNGTAAQTIGGTSTSIFNNLTIGASSAGTTISAGAKVTVSGILTSNNKLTVNSASLTSSGSLIVTGTRTGTVTYNRWLQNVNFQLISAPVNTTSWESTKIKEFEDYTELGDYWTNLNTNKPATLTPGKGFGMIPTSAGTVGFTGILNGLVSKTITRGSDNNWIYGWNLIGNPYTSAIGINNDATSANKFLTVNADILDPDYRAVYVWEAGAYKCIGNSGFTPPGDESLLSDDYVQAGQAFFVRANVGDIPAIQFNVGMQSHQPGITLKSAKKSWPGVQLNAVSGDASHNTIVTYHQDMTPGLDVSYDAGLLSAGGEIELFTRLVNDNGVDFMIQAVPDYDFEQNAVPVGVNFAKGGEVTFSGYVVPLDGNYKIYLEDRLTGVLTDLSQDEYTVTLSANTKGTGRFFVVAAQTTGIETPGEISDNLMIWASDRKIHIRGELSGKATARLLDLNGRLIMETSLPDTRNNLVQAPVRTGGIYLLQVLDGNRHTTRKVVIN